MPVQDLACAVRPLDGPDRLVRSLAAALVCVVAAAVGHHSAGGVLAAPAVLAVFAGSGLVAWLLSSRRVTVGQMIGLLVLCQVGVHLGASTSDMSMGAGMIVAHVAATLLSAAALARGEQLVWHLAERLGLRLVPLTSVQLVVPDGRPPAVVDVPRSLRDVRLAHSRVLRGPPNGLV